MNNLYIYVAIAVILLVVEVAYFRIARRLHIADIPNQRSSHHDVIVRGGGVIFALSIVLYHLFYNTHYWYFLAGLLIVATVSYWDDIHSLPDSVRLIAQTVATLLMFAELGILKPSLWWIIILGLILCVGIINAYNFMDGINGITGAYSLAVISSLAIVNYNLEFIDMSYLIVTAIGCFIFCLFNFRTKAICFAGDVGSISMALIVMFPLAKLIIQTHDFSYIVFLALYGVDTVLTIIHRIMLHENLGQAHRKHAFQILANELKIPHVAVSAGYAIVQMIISVGLIFCSNFHLLYSIIVLLILGFAYIFFMKRYYHLHEEYLQNINSLNTNNH